MIRIRKRFVGSLFFVATNTAGNCPTVSLNFPAFQLTFPVFQVIPKINEKPEPFGGRAGFWSLLTDNTQINNNTWCSLGKCLKSLNTMRFCLCPLFYCLIKRMNLVGRAFPCGETKFLNKYSWWCWHLHILTHFVSHTFVTDLSLEPNTWFIFTMTIKPFREDEQVRLSLTRRTVNQCRIQQEKVSQIWETVIAIRMVLFQKEMSDNDLSRTLWWTKNFISSESAFMSVCQQPVIQTDSLFLLSSRLNWAHFNLVCLISQRPWKSHKHQTKPRVLQKVKNYYWVSFVLFYWDRQLDRDRAPVWAHVGPSAWWRGGGERGTALH